MSDPNPSDGNEQLDPVEDLDIGQSTVVTNVQEFPFWGTSAADPFLGFDRQVEELEITDARIVGEPGNEEILFEVEGQVTRQLPRGAMDFPEATEPSGTPETTKQSESTPMWKRAAHFGIVFGIAGAVFVAVFNRVNAAMASAEPITFSPQPITSVGDVAPILLVLFLALVISATLIDPPFPRGRL